MRALMGSVAVVRVLMVWTAGVGAGGVLRKRGTSSTSPKLSKPKSLCNSRSGSILRNR